MALASAIAATLAALGAGTLRRNAYLARMATCQVVVNVEGWASAAFFFSYGLLFLALAKNSQSVVWGAFWCNRSSKTWVDIRA